MQDAIFGFATTTEQRFCLLNSRTRMVKNPRLYFPPKCYQQPVVNNLSLFRCPEFIDGPGETHAYAFQTGKISPLPVSFRRRQVPWAPGSLGPLAPCGPVEAWQRRFCSPPASLLSPVSAYLHQPTTVLRLL